MPSEQDLSRQQRALVRAYGKFWTQPAFRKAVKRPFVHRSEVQHLLERAAAIVVQVRAELDANRETPAAPVRYIDGASRDFFWQARYKPHATPAKFVHELVHATLKDANGYVEGLGYDKVEDCIKRFDPSLVAKGGDQDHTLELRTQLDEAWHKSSDVLAELRQLAAAGELCGDEYTDSFKRCVAACEALAGQAHHITKMAAKKRKGDSSTEEEARPKTRSKKHSIKADKGEGGPTVVVEEAADDEEGPATPNPTPVAESPRLGDRSSTTASDEDHDHDSAVEEAHMEAYSGRIEVKKVASDVAHISEGVLNLTDSVTRMDPAVLAQDPQGNLERLEELQHRCDQFTDGLVNDLIKLDNLEGLATEDRPLRKSQVNEVQHLIDEVQAVNDKLRNYAHQLRDHLAKQAEAEAKAAEDKKKAEEEAAYTVAAKPEPVAEPVVSEAPKEPAVEAKEPEAATPKKEEHVKSPVSVGKKGHLSGKQREELDELWSQLKLKPHFEVMESLYDYVVQGYVPGLKQSDIDVQLSGRTGSTLTIKGVRKPIEKEYQKMLRFLPGASVDDILRMGVGRFGSFTEQYTLPEDADKERIEAHYEGGVLRVILPKKRNVGHARRPPPPLLAGHNLPELMRDRDLWW